MNEVILCKYGEIILKGANKATFESKLLKQVRERTRPFGRFDVRYAQSTVYVEPQETSCDIDAAYETVKRIFGFAGVTRAAVCEKNMDAICKTAVEYLPEKLRGYKKFRCEAKRSDKLFLLKSPEIAGEVGGAILDVMPELKVDLNNPDITVRIEIREKCAYIHAGQDRGAGGLPYGSSGKGLLLLSGGIDSPVAGYMMAKRGMYIECLHFDSFPYTSEMALEKVLSLAGKLAAYCGTVKVCAVSLTEIQEAIRDSCDEDYFTLILRRCMMDIASRVADACYADALITGESLGQVASQTIGALNVTDIVAEKLVFRPCIGLDKDEIVQLSRSIGTFDTSVLPYEDCCTVFTPRHPKTKPVLERVIAEEEKFDRKAMLDRAFENRRMYSAAVSRS